MSYTKSTVRKYSDSDTEKKILGGKVSTILL